MPLRRMQIRYYPDTAHKAPCPVCGHLGQERTASVNGTNDSVPRRYFKRARTDGTIGIVEMSLKRCPECLLLYLYPQRTQEEMIHYYENIAELSGTGTDQLFMSHIENPGLHSNSASKIHWILKQCNGSGTMLDFLKSGYCMDVGSNAGYFMSAAKSFGLRCIGVEVSPFLCRKNTEVLGIPMINCFLDDVPEEYNKTCTLIVMNDTLEHHSNPVSSMQKVRELLVPGGLLFIDVPNANAITFQMHVEAHPWFESAHLFYFTQQSMTRLLLDTGFELVSFYHPPGGLENDVLRAFGINLSDTEIEDLCRSGQGEKFWTLAMSSRVC